MALQAPWRASGEARRQADIRIAHDPLCQTGPKFLRDFRAARLRDPYSLLARENEKPRTLAHEGALVIRDAAASSDDDEVGIHGARKYDCG